MFAVSSLISPLTLAEKFDNVWYNYIIFRIKQNDRSDKRIICLSNFVRNRKQRVVLKGQDSPCIDVNAKVPQCSLYTQLCF